jgi:dienelactone hydrolase
MVRLSVLGPFALGLLLLGTAATPAAADPAPTFPVKSRLEFFSNRTGEGSDTLRSIVWYPAAKRSRALAEAPEGGHPVIVFLHGRGGFALAYTALGRRLAARGFVVVLSDTAFTDAELQRKDGKALLETLKRVDAAEEGFWAGALNLERAGLSGHSMGGGSTAHILADNPGYRAGFAFAPWQGGLDFDGCTAVEVPLGMVHGEGDRTLAWNKTSQALFNVLPKSAHNFLLLRNKATTHQNPAVLLPFAKKPDREVFEASARLCGAFFRKHLLGQGEELEELLNAEAPGRVRLFRAKAEPAPR